MCRVVIVDDDLGCLEAIAEIAYEAVGMDGTVEAYTDPNEFIEAASCGQRPDLLLVDYVMPSMDGIAALRCLRRRGVDCKAVIISAFPFEVSHKLLPTNNVNLVVAKPFRAVDLSRVVREAILQACDLPARGVAS